MSDILNSDVLDPIPEAKDQIGIAQDFYDDSPDIDRNFHLQKAQALALVSIADSLQRIATATEEQSRAGLRWLKGPKQL